MRESRKSDPGGEVVGWKFRANAGGRVRQGT